MGTGRTPKWQEEVGGYGLCGRPWHKQADSPLGHSTPLISGSKRQDGCGDPEMERRKEGDWEKHEFWSENCKKSSFYSKSKGFPWRFLCKMQIQAYICLPEHDGSHQHPIISTPSICLLCPPCKKPIVHFLPIAFLCAFAHAACTAVQ